MKRFHVAVLMILFAFATSGDYLTFFICLPTMLLAGWQLAIIDKQEFGAEDMLWFCILIFFGVAPSQSFVKGYFPANGSVSGVYFEYIEIALAQLIVLLFFISFIFGESFVRQGRNLRLSNIKSEVTLSSGHIFTLIFVIFFSLIAYVVFAGGVANILSARTEKDGDAGSFVAAIFLAMLVVANIYAVDLRVNNKNTKHINILLGMCLFFGVSSQVFCLNPYNSPRFFLIGSWLPFALVLARRFLTFKSIYFFVLIGIFVVMPTLGVTTRYGVSGNENYVIDISENPFLIKDVDVLDTLAYMIKYVENSGYAFGENLAAILLFFVPRELWPSKPLVGGLVVGWELYFMKSATTPNLSFFVGGDLFMDFSYVGVVLGAFVTGILFKKLLAINHVPTSGYLLSAAVAGALPILIRGPVGAVIGYPLCLIVCCLCAAYIRGRSIKGNI